MKYRIAIIGQSLLSMFGGSGPEFKWHEGLFDNHDEALKMCGALNAAMTEDNGRVNGFAFVVPYDEANRDGLRDAVMEHRKNNPTDETRAADFLDGLFRPKT